MNITPRLGFTRYIPEVSNVMEDAEQRWHRWFTEAPPVEDEYQAQYYFAWWLLRAGLISTRFYTTREAMTPSLIHYMRAWQWHAFYADLARELRRRTLDLINSRDDIYEYYHPVNGENPPSAASMFGWASAVFIDLAIQAAREKSR